MNDERFLTELEQIGKEYDKKLAEMNFLRGYIARLCDENQEIYRDWIEKDGTDCLSWLEE